MHARPTVADPPQDRPARRKLPHMTRQTFDHEAAGAMLAGGMTPQEVADRFGVSRSSVYLLRARHPELCTPERVREAHPNYPPSSPSPEPGTELLRAVLAFVEALDRRVLAALGEHRDPA